eukprot:scaffold14784_cov234-Alexandrium_tamarense.AAC.3
MSFFGLTALGEQNPFASETNRRTLHLFSEQDWRNAWERVIGDEVLLKELYFGPAPELELEIIDRALPWIKGRVKWTALRREFLNIQKIQKEEALKVEHTGDSSPMFTSNHDYRDAVRSHTAGHHNSQKIMTTNQSYGKKRSNDDSEGIPQHKIRAKKSCDETRYQSELIKSGFIY